MQATSKCWRCAHGFTAPLLFLWALTALVLVPLRPAWAQPTADTQRAYRLQHTSADSAAERTRALLSELDSKTRVVIDRERNSVVVRGNDEVQRLAAELLQTIDQPPRRPAERPAEGQVVRGYQVPADKLEATAARLRSQFSAEAAVRVATDPRTGQVIVVASADVQRKVAQQLGERAPAQAMAEGQETQNTNDDGPSSGEAPTAQVPAAGSYRLEHTTWRELEDALRRTWSEQLVFSASGSGEVVTVARKTADGQRPAMQIDRRNDTVSFPATGKPRDRWERLVEAIDQPATAADQQMQLIALENADSDSARTAVSAIQAAARDQQANGAAAALPLSDPRARPRWGGELVSMIFQQNGQLQNGQVEDQAEEDGEAGGLIGPVEIEFLEGLDVIVIRGHRRDVERVREIIADIERLSVETQPVIEVDHLQHVNSQALATLIDELYEETFLPRQGPVSIRALVQPNALLLIGREESVAVVRDMIQKLDKPSTATGRFVIFRLKHIAATDAEETLRNFFASRPGIDTDLREGLGTRVQVLADYRSNSLIVHASPRDLAEVEQLIESIDVEQSETTAEIRIFRLRHALAEDLAQVMQAAIAGEAPPGQQQQPGQQPGQSTLPAASLEFMMIDKGQLLRSGILTNVQVTADPNINALVVRAPSESMELIAALVDQLDRMPEAEAQIKVFTIINGDATSLAAMLQQLFGQPVTAGQGTAQFALGFGAQQQQLQQQLQTAADGEGSLVPLRFAVDERTNSIIASGSPSNLQVVETLLYRLDIGDIESRRLQVIRLKHAPAQDVANSITAFLTTQRQLVQQQLLFNQAISAFEQIEREVIVVPEVVTNSLIVSATPRYFDEIMEIIRDLDFRPPMVMVQVLIAEVSLDDVFQFGVELGLQDSLLFDRGIAGIMSDPGFNFNNVGLPNESSAARGLLAGQSLTSFSLGRTNNTLGYGGMVLSAANESISILIRALQDAGRLQVLSRPQIMALNNQQAFIQVGADVSRITGTTITQGIVQNNIEDVQTGLILRIQPLINEDGIVVMNLDAERSALGDEAAGTPVAIQDGETIRSPPIERTTAQTTISAKSGQTVVFAGLITKEKSLSLRRVPWISDLPVLGRLFEFETAIERRNELLIVMTPHIISEDEDYEFINAIESQRMNYCLADLIEVHGEVGLQGGSDLFCCGEAPVIYPHVDPAGQALLAAPPDGGPADSLSSPESSRRHFNPASTSPDGSGAVPTQKQPAAGADAAGPDQAAPSEAGQATSVSYGPPPAESSGIRPASYDDPRQKNDAQPQGAMQRLPAIQPP